ncbi:MAG TPA: hypothetical protein VKE51_17655 [Vicinamibacterales bacterium]|nr:hypothetical protein [Vicinamibacterales bacterium]
MRRAVFVCAVVSLMAGGGIMSGQGGGNPFVDHSDTGETVHVLPAPASIHSPHATQPTDAPPHRGVSVFPASYGSGNLVNHGGRQIPFAGFFAIYWNGTVASTAGSQGQPNLRSEVQSFVTSFSTSADYSIITQYGAADAISPVLAWAGDFVDSRAPQGSFSDSKVRSYIASLFNSGVVAADASTVYGVYFPSGMKITMQGGASCSAFCGYHGHFAYNGKDIKYAVFPYTDCRACSLPGKAVADMLTIVTSHEVREAVTDPDLDAWFDAAGYEADDKCAWHNLYQTASGHFWVQPEYSNGLSGNPGPGCIVP